MKKTLFIAVLAAVLVFAFASSAFASKGPSIQRTGDGTPSIYMDWNWAPTSGGVVTTLSAWGDNPPATSPHGNYTAATVKCQVCHAVHQAAPSGDTLLRVTADMACIYCHVDTNTGIGGAIVYGGNAAIATASGDDHHTIGTGCDECHASVHGSGAITDIPALTGLLLKDDNANEDHNPVTILASLEASGTPTNATGYTQAQYLNGTATRGAAVGVWCSGCHQGSYQNYLPSESVSYGRSGGVKGFYKGQFVGHRVMAVANANWNAGNSVSSSSKTTGQVAFAPAEQCNSCHDADNGFGAPGFPHYTPGASRFMNQAEWAGAPLENAAGYTADPTDTNFYSNSTNANRFFSVQDGTCIKCHRGSATTGVGFDY